MEHLNGCSAQLFNVMIQYVLVGCKSINGSPKPDFNRLTTCNSKKMSTNT